MNRVIVVGGSLAGLRAAETLRSGGFDGRVTIVGAEPHRPYDRPPLSKQILTGEWELDRIGLPAGSDDRLDAEWLLGRRAMALDTAGRSLELDDGTHLDWDGLVITTGTRARTLPGTEGLDGVVALRTNDDAARIRKRLDAGAAHVTVVGAGFIGCEVAASCRTRGIAVTMVEPLAQPLARVLGDRMGEVVAGLHRSHDVDLRTSTGVVAVHETDSGLRVELDDGTRLDTDLVVVGIGVVPEASWLEGSGLMIDDGVVCDETTLVAPGIVAAGDIARWPHPLYGELMRVEHWEHALDMASHAARRLLADAAGEAGEPYRPIPWFWTDQYDRKFQLAGRPRPDDEIAIVAGSLDADRFCALYGRDGRATAVFAMNMAGRVVRTRRRLADGIDWDEVLVEATENAASNESAGAARNGGAPEHAHPSENTGART